MNFILIALVTISTGTTFQEDLLNLQMDYNTCRVQLAAVKDNHPELMPRIGSYAKVQVGKEFESGVIDNVVLMCQKVVKEDKHE